MHTYIARRGRPDRAVFFLELRLKSDGFFQLYLHGHAEREVGRQFDFEVAGGFCSASCTSKQMKEKRAEYNTCTKFF